MKLKRFLSIACVSALIGCSPLPQAWIDSKINGAVQVSSSNLQLGQSEHLKLPTQPTLGYQIETYHSRVFGRDRTFGVTLPPGYEKQPHSRYPVIFLLHGGHGDPTTWFIKGKALTVIETLYATGKLPPSIIVTPDGNDSRGTNPYWDPEYVNGQYGNVLSAIGDELVQEIKSRYRTVDDPAFWAIGGLSSGGWGALNVGLHHPENFKILFSHSGYFIDKSGAENSPIDYIKTLDPEMRRSLAIYLDAGEGEGDREYLAQSIEFQQVLNQLEVENRLNQFPGGHRGKQKKVTGFWHRQYQKLVDLSKGGRVKEQDISWNFWHRHLADSLSYVGERFRAVEQSRVRAKQFAPTSQIASTKPRSNLF